MAWSSVPITAQEGIVAQAGTPDSSVNAFVASGRCVAASAAPSLLGRPFARQPGKTLGLT